MHDQNFVAVAISLGSIYNALMAGIVDFFRFSQYSK